MIGRKSFQASLFNQELRVERKLQLWRGKLLKFKGASTGIRFGVGRSVQLLYPFCFTAGDDVFISDFSFLHCLSDIGVRIGDRTSIDRNFWLHCGREHGPGCFEIGSDSYVGCNAVMGAGGPIRIGSNVLIAQFVSITAENHLFSDPARLIKDQGISNTGVTIEDDVWIASKVTILDGVKIGKGSVIGAGSVVTRSIPSGVIAAGNPAKVIKPL